jgi:hypothetical protein
MPICGRDAIELVEHSLVEAFVGSVLGFAAARGSSAPGSFDCSPAAPARRFFHTVPGPKTQYPAKLADDVVDVSCRCENVDIRASCFRRLGRVNIGLSAYGGHNAESCCPFTIVSDAKSRGSAGVKVVSSCRLTRIECVVRAACPANRFLSATGAWERRARAAGPPQP